MVLDAVSNFVRGETDAALDDTETTVSVADASIFPDPATDGEYNLVIWDASSFPRPDQDDGVEIVRVTARDTSGDDLTVTRGQEGTSASAHPDGSALHLSPTAKMFSDIDAGKADDPHDNSAHSETFTTADDNVEGFATAGGEGTVPTSQGDGTLAMEDAGGEVTTVDPTEAVEGEEPTADDSDADNPLAIAVAGNALANDDNAVAIGNEATSTGTRSLSIGNSATAAETGSVTIGPFSESGDERSVTIGRQATATARDAVCVGAGTEGNGVEATAVGRDSIADDANTVALGRNAEALSEDEGVIGVSTSDFGPSDWTVPGDFTVNGSKDFQIDHPSKPETHDLRHGAYEGPVPGGLIYNATVTADAERVDLAGDLPEYVTNGDFGTGWTCHVTASDHFGRGYVDADEWVLVVEEPGDYEVTIFGERDDDAALARGGHRTEKPKGEGWNGDPRTYWRDCPHADATDYGDVHRIEAKFDHTPDCSPEPCEEAHVMCRVTFSDGERVEVEDAGFEEPADSLVEKARALRE